eukprot:PhF_6_TR1068/c0_g1_i2/m.2245
MQVPPSPSTRMVQHVQGHKPWTTKDSLAPGGPGEQHTSGTRLGGGYSRVSHSRPSKPLGNNRTHNNMTNIRPYDGKHVHQDATATRHGTTEFHNVDEANASRYVKNLREQVSALEEELQYHKNKAGGGGGGARVPQRGGAGGLSGGGGGPSLSKVEDAIHMLRDQYHTANQEHEFHVMDMNSRHEADVAVLRAEAAKKMEEMAAAHKEYERTRYHKYLAEESKNLTQITHLRDLCLQSEKEAEKFKALHEKVQLEKEMLEKVVSAMKMERMAQEEALTTITDQLNASQQEANHLRTELGECRKRIAASVDTLELEKLMAKQNQVVVGHEERMKILESVVNDRENEIAELRNELLQLQRKYEKETLNSRTKESTAMNLDLQNQTNRVTIAELTSELEFYKSRAMSLTDDVARVTERCEVLTGKLNMELERRHVHEIGQQRVTLEVRELEDRAMLQVTALEHSIKAQEALQCENDQLRMKLDVAHKEVMDWKKEHSKLLDQIHAAQSRQEQRVVEMRAGIDTLSKFTQDLQQTQQDVKSVFTNFLVSTAEDVVIPVPIPFTTHNHEPAAQEVKKEPPAKKETNKEPVDPFLEEIRLAMAAELQARQKADEECRESLLAIKKAETTIFTTCLHPLELLKYSST